MFSVKPVCVGIKKSPIKTVARTATSLLCVLVILCFFASCKTIEPVDSVVPTEKTKPDLFNSGTFVITAHCPCDVCCGRRSDSYTATGAKATEGRTLSVDEDVIPFGTEVVIDGHKYVAEDNATNAINGYEVSIFFDTHEEVVAYGEQFHQVYVSVDEFVK